MMIIPFFLGKIRGFLGKIHGFLGKIHGPCPRPPSGLGSRTLQAPAQLVRLHLRAQQAPGLRPGLAGAEDTHGKIIGNTWENHRKPQDFPWENHRKPMGFTMRTCGLNGIYS